MNILGHNYIAWKVIGRLNELTAAGSEIPDIVPFVTDSVFTFEVIHESGEKFLEYLDQNYPEKRDLALAMMCHSVKFGADCFNRDIETWLIGENETLKKSLATKIADCASIPYEVAYHNRLHNYLWAGTDFYIMDLEKGFTEALYETFRNINREIIVELLTNWSNQDPDEIEGNLNARLGPHTRWDFRAPRGYISALKDFHHSLSEHDNIDPDKGVILLNEIYETFGDKWKEVLDKVILSVKEKMEPYL